MENLEPYPGFYDGRGYGEYEKQFLHNATVSMLKYLYIIKIVFKLSTFHF